MKTIKEVAEETKWLDTAEVYAKSKGWDNLIDFTDIDFWMDYRNNYDLSPEEAVDDYMCEQD